MRVFITAQKVTTDYQAMERKNIMVTTYHIPYANDTPYRETNTDTLNTRGLVQMKPILSPNYDPPMELTFTQ